MNTRILAVALAVAAAVVATYAAAAHDQVTICHRPGGDTTKARTLSVARSAVPAHLAHGDQIGACPASGSR